MRMRPPRYSALFWAFFLALLTAEAFADGLAPVQMPVRVNLEYQRGDGAGLCPDASALQVGVAGRLGYDPFDGQAADRLRVAIRQVGHGLEARIEMADLAGKLKAERRLVSRQRDCKELASSVELAIAIAIDPTGMPPANAAPTDGPSGSAPGEVAPVPPTLAQPSPAPRRPRAGDLQALLVGGWRSAPSPSLGLQVGADLRGEVWTLGVEARADLPSSQSLRVGRVKTSLYAGSLVPCLGSAYLRFCALASAGLLRSSADGLDDEHDANLFYAALGARIALSYPIDPRWSVALHAQASSPLTETTLTVDGSAVWHTPTLVYAVALGATAKIP